MDNSSNGDSDDSDYEYTSEEDVIDEGKCVADQDSSHPSYAWWEPGAVAPSEPWQYCYSDIDALDHMKSLLGGDMTMSIMQLPAEEDYWKEGRVDAIVYPTFKAWMIHTRFKFIKKN
eukprot:7032492-Ditylum_brightwellii.AAC.1